MKKKTALYLDDIRTPTDTIPGYEPWDVVRNYAEFTEYILRNGIPDLISFDHDLAREHMEDYALQVGQQGFQNPDYQSYKEKTGMDCAAWLCQYAQDNNLRIKYCSVHSHNPVGAGNIQTFINNFKIYMGWTPDCFITKHPFTVKENN